MRVRLTTFLIFMLLVSVVLWTATYTAIMNEYAYNMERFALNMQKWQQMRADTERINERIEAREKAKREHREKER